RPTTDELATHKAPEPRPAVFWGMQTLPYVLAATSIVLMFAATPTRGGREDKSSGRQASCPPQERQEVRQESHRVQRSHRDGHSADRCGAGTGGQRRRGRPGR